MDFFKPNYCKFGLFFLFLQSNYKLMMDTETVFADLLQYIHNRRYYQQMNINSLLNDSNIEYEQKLEKLSQAIGEIALCETKITIIQDKLNQLNNIEK